MAGTPRWGNTFYPRVGQWVTVTGEVVGEYKFDNRESLRVVLDDFTPAPAATRAPSLGQPKQHQGMISYVSIFSFLTNFPIQSLKRFRSAVSSSANSPSKAPRRTTEDPVTLTVTREDSLETVLEDD